MIQILAASVFGYAAARVAAAHLRRKKLFKALPLDAAEDIIPRLGRSESGRVQQLEKFSHFVGNFTLLKKKKEKEK